MDKPKNRISLIREIHQRHQLAREHLREEHDELETVDSNVGFEHLGRQMQSEHVPDDDLSSEISMGLLPRYEVIPKH